MSDYITMIDNIKITLVDGVASLTGIDYRALRAILNGARLHLYESKPKAEPLEEDRLGWTHKSNLERFIWYIDMHYLVDVIDAHLRHAISPEFEKLGLNDKKAMRDMRMKTLEDDVRQSEEEAAKGKLIHPLDENIETLSNSIAQAVQALAKLKEIRREKPKNWWVTKEEEIRAALQPASERALTRAEAERLVYMSASCFRQGLSIDNAIPKILNDIFGMPEPIIQDLEFL